MARKIKCVVVDDEELSRKMLQELISKLPNWELIGSFPSAIKARPILQEDEVDVLFLDVEMEELSGLELLRVLAHKPEVIIVSGREKYAIDAFEYEVTDFLLKPVAMERFMKAVQRVENRLDRDDDHYSDQDTVFVKANNTVLGVKLQDIQYVEAFGDYVNIFTEKDRLVVHATMKGIETKLPSDQFVRVHRSYIVRVDKINGIDETLVVMGKKLIPIGDSYRADLMARLNFL